MTARRRSWRGLVTAVVTLASAFTAACGATPTAGRSPAPAQDTPALARLLRPGPAPQYYLALGDSLSIGIQPNPAGAGEPTASAYPRQLDAMLRQAGSHLTLVQLGCSGETTRTMIRGGICRYPRGSQLREAVAFLRAHRHHVPLVTIDIGANDPNHCIRTHGIAAVTCLTASETRGIRDLNTIMAAVRSAAGPAVVIVGMTYYVPELGLWLAGRTGVGLAAVAEGLAAGYDRRLSGVYQRYGARVANVYAAFGSADFRHRAFLPGYGTVPKNVATICSLTWMCAPAPRGPNEHANAAGYRVIARAFLRSITR